MKLALLGVALTGVQAVLHHIQETFSPLLQAAIRLPPSRCAGVREAIKTRGQVQPKKVQPKDCRTLDCGMWQPHAQYYPYQEVWCVSRETRNTSCMVPAAMYGIRTYAKSRGGGHRFRLGPPRPVHPLVSAPPSKTAVSVWKVALFPLILSYCDILLFPLGVLA